ncbi:MAG: hypothetical protein ACKVT0_22380 [Planctomycetaceae bacterium]
MYGRFGSWFGSQTLTEGGSPVKITYRVWLQDGEMTVEECQGLSANFATPADVATLSE